MYIQDMFNKSIDRDIKGVIKVGQDNTDVIKQELEEYVVTKELQKHFDDFFVAYKKGINNYTDKMGVWISGFFGSGKSHFLKILSYLLENKLVYDKNAIDYLLEDEKIENEETIINIKEAISVPTDVILFNIDSKSDATGTKDKSTLLNVFLKVFNEKLDLSSNPHLADLERQLKNEGKYTDFQEKFYEIDGNEWLDSRHKFKFILNTISQALIKIGFMDERSVELFIEKSKEPYQISIEDFAKLVKQYLDQQGEDHHLIFLVDEMGQYIGDNTDLMLNLQTITEDLGSICRGKAWVIVTSQQDIDSITAVKGNDFSKIQGRFDTRLNLTSANVDEVIKLRILAKNDRGQEVLLNTYHAKETILRNLIIFDDKIEKKLFQNGEDFVEVYPFIPYQFNILGSVLTSIRKYGASGKHLSEGERSMLALFKESAEGIKDQKEGVLISFDSFYDPLKRFLDHSHANVISKAIENKEINPNSENNPFIIKVLKVLFLIKYVKEIKANIENITTLMVSHVDEDRKRLKDDVEEALQKLEQQTLIQRNGDIYTFLSDDEQEVNRMIANQDIDHQEVIKEVSEIIFADIFPDEKIKANHNPSRYQFPYHRQVDELPYKAPQSELGIIILTPQSEYNGNEQTLKTKTAMNHGFIYVDMPSDAEFIRELQSALKIEKFITSPSIEVLNRFEEVQQQKRREMKEHQERGKLFLQEALKESVFYINGDTFKTSSKDFNFNAKEALQKVVSLVYAKLYYMNKACDIEDITTLFESKKESTNVEIDLHSNENAIIEVQEDINRKTGNHASISLKEIKNRFKKPQYGYVDLDIAWIIAKLFKDEKISISYNKNKINTLQNSSREIVEYLTKTKFEEKVLIEEKEQIPQNYIRSFNEVMRDGFRQPITSENTDQMAQQLQKYAQNRLSEIMRIHNLMMAINYPGRNTVVQGKEYLEKIIEKKEASELFLYIHNKKEDILDFFDDYEYIKEFMDGNQKEIWDKALVWIGNYEKSKTYIDNPELKEIINSMTEILDLSEPYNKIKNLAELTNQVISIFGEILNIQQKEILLLVKSVELDIKTYANENKLSDQYKNKLERDYKELYTAVEKIGNLAALNGFKQEVKELKSKHFNEINKNVEKRRLQDEQERKRNKTSEENTDERSTSSVSEEENLPLVKKRISIQIAELNNTTWKIEEKEDIEKYLSQLREKLINELKEDTIIEIDF